MQRIWELWERERRGDGGGDREGEEDLRRLLEQGREEMREVRRDRGQRRAAVPARRRWMDEEETVD